MPAPGQLCAPKHAETLSPAIAFSMCRHGGVRGAAGSSKPHGVGRCLSVRFAAPISPPSLPPPDMGTERNQP